MTQEKIKGLSRDEIAKANISVSMDLLIDMNDFVAETAEQMGLDLSDLLFVLGLEARYEPGIMAAAYQWKNLSNYDRNEIKSWALLSPQARREQIVKDKGISSEEQIDRYMLALNDLNKRYVDYGYEELDKITAELVQLDNQFSLGKLLQKIYKLIRSQYNKSTRQHGNFMESFVELLHDASGFDKDVLLKTHYRYLWDLFLLCYKQPKEGQESVNLQEAEQGNLRNSIDILSPIGTGI